MLSSSVRIQTSNPSRLIRRLCKHWGHKFEVNFDDQHGRIALGETTCLAALSASMVTDRCWRN